MSDTVAAIPEELPRRLTVVDATTVVIGSMIGSGIFLKASTIAQKVADPRLVLAVWIVSGLLTLFGALALAELGAAYPRAGGLYAYLHDAYGPLVAFLFGWSLLAVLQTGSIAGMAAGIARAFAAQVPITPVTETLIAGALVVALTVVNVVSVRAGALVQNVFTVAKSLGILLLIFGGFAMTAGRMANLSTPGTPTAGLPLASAFGMAMVGALWAYDGWVNVTFLAGEVQQPQRNLPRALILGTLFVIAVYAATNAAYHFALPVPAIQQAKNVSRDLAQAVLGSAGAVAMTILAMISTAGALNGSVMSGARVTFAMARERWGDRGLGAIHRRFMTPHLALYLQCAWSLGLLALWKTFDTLTDNVIFVYWIFYGLGAAAVIVMRRRDPQTPRPYRAPAYPWLPLVFVAGAIYLTVNTVWSAPRASLEALGLLGIGLLIYPLYRTRGDASRSSSHGMEADSGIGRGDTP